MFICATTTSPVFTPVGAVTFTGETAVELDDVVDAPTVIDPVEPPPPAVLTVIVVAALVFEPPALVAVSFTG
jgi:hypothetical protein